MCVHITSTFSVCTCTCIFSLFTHVLNLYAFVLSGVLSSADPAIETDFSGTTFTCAVIRGNTMTTGNIGDSRSTIGYRNAAGDITGIAISQDHKPDLPEEKARIEAKGGRVFAVEYDDGVDGPPWTCLVWP